MLVQDPLAIQKHFNWLKSFSFIFISVIFASGVKSLNTSLRFSSWSALPVTGFSWYLHCITGLFVPPSKNHIYVDKYGEHGETDLWYGLSHETEEEHPHGWLWDAKAWGPSSSRYLLGWLSWYVFWHWEDIGCSHLAYPTWRSDCYPEVPYFIITIGWHYLWYSLLVKLEQTPSPFGLIAVICHLMVLNCS